MDFIGIRGFLYETQLSLIFISRLKSKESFLSDILVFNANSEAQDRVSISPHDIFRAGYDIAVYGGAGVGKTTTLKRYAQLLYDCKNRHVLYVPLNKLVDDFRSLKINAQKPGDLKYQLLTKIILLVNGLSTSKEHIDYVERVFSKNLTLILDGLDEVYSTIPEIVPALSAFKCANPDTQLIVASRDCVSFLKNIDFLGITLLPFTEEQLIRFVRGWFGGSEKSEQLISAIIDRNLFEHIKTPLLATITCALVSKGIDAPSSESEIYSERIRLLTGQYDLYKNIHRQKHNSDLLRKCATKLAFAMHTRNTRFLSKSELESILCESLLEHHASALLKECLEDLISPCNIR